MEICERLGLALPLIQAPMAGVSTPAMAAAVCNSGALGSIAVGASTADAAAAMIARTAEMTQKALNINCFVHPAPVPDPVKEAAWCDWLAPQFARFDAAPPPTLRTIYRSLNDHPELVAVLIAARPAVISFHFGVPDPAIITALRAAGSVLLASATNLAEATALVAVGIDMIIAQGFEAGGHRGMFDPDARDDALGTMALTRMLVRALPVPVIAAGGIMDGAGIAAACRLGASAAQLGTAFIACAESAADAGYRAALLAPGAWHTQMTSVVSGRPARCLPNRFTALDTFTAWDKSTALDNGYQVRPPPYPIAYDAGKALHAAAKARGEHGFGAHWAGQGAPLARAMPAADLVATLAREFAAASSMGLPSCNDLASI